MMKKRILELLFIRLSFRDLEYECFLANKVYVESVHSQF